ncbi:hypothetical protein LAUMK4_05851 [Mycobacterium persicum]|uniref:Uncharacterized protein n=1 Tax=Mycobacterium persicum TaxID=1487726 RepID=A0ABY6RSI5_9MYCO|nr:hypothetical protein [Mycobacterium persicum]VAZ77484.1 hypothetical protein LAUMK15_03856 [Mycobacterium persicum]VBA33030.1 hypothetical protein LAUMK4_05851 [Mycobacterium persicum]
MTVTATRPIPTDGNLPAARRLLADAISSLIDPQPWVDNNRTYWLDSRYHQLRDALTAQRVGASHKPASKPPAWIDAIDLLRDIDRRTCEIEQQVLDLLNPETRQQIPAWIIGDCDDWPTVQRLRQVDGWRKWRPQDTALIGTITGDLARFITRIDQLFAAAPKTLPDKCPQCGNSETRRRIDDGGIVSTSRVPALQITDDGCTCQHCKAHWPPDRLVFLGRVLGYRIEGVIET